MATNPLQVSLSAMADNRIPARASLSSDEHAGEKADVKDGSDGVPEVDHGSKAEVLHEDGGVTRIDALYLVFGKGWGLYSLWASIALIACSYSLSRSTTAYYAQFATSSFGEHTIIGTIGVINGVLAGVAPPFIAKLADVWSRPHALALSVLLYAVGYAMVAGARNITTVVAGQVVYTLGNTGITFLNSLLIADITSLQWRPLVDGLVNLPYVVNAFVAGFIVSGINGYSANGWRWGYGMFCILLPVTMAPALAVLLIGDRRAKQLGVLSLAASSRARRMQLGEEDDVVARTRWQSVRFYWTRLNAFGLLLMGFAFALILTPITLSTTATGGYKNPSIIAMLVCGGVLFISWAVWDGFFSQYPFMPKRVFNRTFIACVGADFFYFFGTYLIDTYYSSWVYVIVDWNDRDIAFFNNTSSVALCGFAFLGGLGMRYTRNYKYWQIGGLLVRCIGQGLVYQSSKTPTTALLVTSQVLIGLGGSVSVIASYIGVQGSLAHQDMAIGTAVLNLWASVGSSISIAISSTVWNKQVPAKLEEYLGATHNATERAEIFGSIYIARAAEPRDLVKQSYLESVNHLWMAGLIVTCLAVVSASFAKNFRLGQNHNNVELEKVIKFRDQNEIDEELQRMKVAQAEAEAKQ